VERNQFYARWSALHGDTPANGIVKAWLAISYSLMRPFVLLKVSPHLITIFGVVASIATWLSAPHWYAALLLIASLAADGVDGTLAVLRGVEGKWGAIVDALSDRISEVFWALAFYKIGAPVIVIALSWLAAGTQEYVRARMGGLGETAIHLVTIAERPVRASLLFVALVSIHTNYSMVNRAAWMWLIMQLISFVLVFNDGYRRLK
jgi:phosphatidylglycerophosphate synthase